MNRRSALRLGAASVAAGLAAPWIAGGSARAADETVLKASDVHPEGYPTVVAVENMGKKLSAATGGKLSVRMYSSMQLGDEKAAIEQAQIGAIQLARVSVGAIGPVVDALNVFNLPFVFKDTAHMRRVIDGPVGADLLAEIATTTNGKLVGLCWMDAGSRNFYNRVRPVRGIADLRGMKVRVIPNPMFVAMANALGANAVAMGYDQVFSALQTGVIDGAENNPPSYVFDHHYEVAKNFSYTEHLIVPEILVLSGAAWNKFSKPEQEAIRRLGREAQMEERTLWDAKVAQAEAMMTKGGVQVVRDIDKAPFQQAVKPVWDKFGAKYEASVKRIQSA